MDKNNEGFDISTQPGTNEGVFGNKNTFEEDLESLMNKALDTEDLDVSDYIIKE